ncbi:MAG: KUP/HAK/KT family potassium transporter [Dysgonomonas sp.]
MENKHHKVPFGPLGIIMAIGVVYGDIGTSPLYVMKSILLGLPAGQLSNPDYILGAVSCIIWTLTMQTTIKYVIITLRADNNGEGGILSLYALIRKKYRWAYIIAAMGAATLLADGAITPAMTIISSVEGLNVVIPSIPVIPVTVTIILALFLIQPFGTGSLGKYFGTVMLFWFIMIGVLGLDGMMGHLNVLKAFNPFYAIRFIIEAPNTLVILGAVFLCTTGAEALYSDLGHCGLKNIRISWVFVKSMLILNYLGQAAWIINNPTLVYPEVNPFFAMMPSWFRLIGIAMATLAAIIASQALISGSFTIISEAISLNLWPNVKIKYPTTIKGQMYIPSVNKTLMVLCLLMVLIFGSSTRLEAAYGLAITLSMLMTSILLFMYFQQNKKPLWQSVSLTLLFITIEFSFFIANMQKFTHGGYASILIAGILFVLMYCWYNGRRIKRKHTIYDHVDDAYFERVKSISEDKTINKTATHLAYITRAKNKNALESKITYSLFAKTPKRADTYWFVYINRSDAPYEFNYSVKTFVTGSIFRIDMNVGFKIGVHADQYVQLIANELEKQGLVDLKSRYPSMNSDRGDFAFVAVDRIFRNVELKFRQSLIMYVYSLIARLGSSDAQMLDLDPSTAIRELVPIVAPHYERDNQTLNKLLHKAEEERDKFVE